MVFLVDGYNVAMADPDTRDLDKERMRSELVVRLGARGRGLLGAGRIVVVFDARGQYGLSTEVIAGIHVVYAADADTEIVRLAGGANEQVVVVTNDLRLRARVSQDVGRHVEYRDASVCFASAAPARKNARGGIARETGLPKGANDITEELKKLWLDSDDE